jgi:D-alanine-D-alanine ligase
MHPCARCAQVQQTCCQRAEIVLTRGDLARVSAATGRADFFEFRAPSDPVYGAVDPSDPHWAAWTVRADGTRRVLTRQRNGDCTFLGVEGCTMTEEQRPLVCRLYPFTYTEQRITGVDSDYCPSKLLAPRGESMVDVLGMSAASAERWRRMLYDELRQEAEDEPRGADTMPRAPLRIGLTYDLRTDYAGQGLSAEALAELDAPETIDALAGTLLELGHQVERIGNLGALLRALSQGTRWDLVFNIAEGMAGIGREAQVPAVLDAFAIPYTFSDPLVSALTLHKGMTKRVVRDLGVHTPAFAVVATLADVDDVDLRYPLFAKPVAEGTSKGIDAASKVTTPAALRATCARLLAHFKQPVLVEEFLPGREVTVGLLGTGKHARVAAVLEVHLLSSADQDAYTYKNKAEWESRVRYALADDAFAQAAGELALRAWRGLGCRDAGRVDVRADAQGRPAFIEVNPLAGLRPGVGDLPIMCELAGMPYRALIGAIVASARARMRCNAGLGHSCGGDASR